MSKYNFVLTVAHFTIIIYIYNIIIVLYIYNTVTTQRNVTLKNTKVITVTDYFSMTSIKQRVCGTGGVVPRILDLGIRYR